MALKIKSHGSILESTKSTLDLEIKCQNREPKQCNLIGEAHPTVII